MRGDLQEGNVYDKRLCGYASRCQFPLFPVPIPLLPSTKTPFLCFFGLRNPCFRAFRAHNRHFCVRMGNFPLVFGRFEHKIGVFVLGKWSGERAVTLVWSIMVCEEVFVFVFDLIWRVWELVLRGIVECCIFDFWRLGGDWLEMMGCGCWLWIGL